MEQIVSLCKRRGFIFPGSEIYGGLAGTWDYGPYGADLKRNIKNLWWKMFVDDRDDIYGVDAAILMNEKVWEASGHTGAGFTDPIVECEKCHHRFRADQLENKKKCPDCGGKLGEERAFNLMFETKVGAEGTQKSYLRPETAQGIFVNFKNVVDSIHPKLPFGIAQIGKAFRNEIAPRDFIFRGREFEQMEIEYFIREVDWQFHFDYWEKARMEWCVAVGMDKDKLHVREHDEKERSHYSKKTTDIEFDFPFGTKELYGLAYRGDYDLKGHSKHSGASLTYLEEGSEPFIPHVIEPSVGVDRAVLAVFCSAYKEDDMGGEKRIYLKFNPAVAPVKAAVFPLLKNKPELVSKARGVFDALKKEVPQVMFDDNGNIGKRYRRQDEIGTPFCITVDFDTLGEQPELKDTVTVRNRDTGAQDRMPITEAITTIKNAVVLG